MFSDKFSCSFFASVCLIVGCVLCSGPVAAQGSNGTPTNKAVSGAEKKKDFKFEVISIRPLKPGSGRTGPTMGITSNGFVSELTIPEMILTAYIPVGSELGMPNATRILNFPSGMADMYSINARVSDDDREAWSNQGSHQELLRSALRNLLKERCKLAIHEQSTDIQDVHLIVKKKGPKLQATPAEFVMPAGVKLASGGVMVGGARGGPTAWHFYGATMGDLAFFLSRGAGRPFHDMTGLTGRYNFMLQIADNPSHDVDEMVYNWPVDSLGLELKPGKGTGLALVIDHIEKPSSN